MKACIFIVVIVQLLSTLSFSYIAKGVNHNPFNKYNSFTRSSSSITLYQSYGSTTISEPENEVSYSNRLMLKDSILQQISLSDRGQTSDKKLLNDIYAMLNKLESLNPNPSPTTSPYLQGNWRLLFANDDITRTSPFFWAFRKAMRAFKDPLLAQPLTESIFKFTDSKFFGFKNIGECTQRITLNQIISQVRLNINPVGSSLMTTTCIWIPKSNSNSNGDELEVTVQKTEVLESSFLSVLDSIPFPSKESLELIKKGSATVDMKITYLDESIRVTRNEVDDKIFVFKRITV